MGIPVTWGWSDCHHTKRMKTASPMHTAKLLRMQNAGGQKYSTKQTVHTVFKRARVQHCNTVEHD
jgi:hypothetical protein